MKAMQCVAHVPVQVYVFVLLPGRGRFCACTSACYRYGYVGAYGSTDLASVHLGMRRVGYAHAFKRGKHHENGRVLTVYICA